MNIVRPFFSHRSIRRFALIFIAGLYSMNIGLSQSCTICSQADVDNFTGLLVGDVVISGPDITNLDALSDNIPTSIFSLFSFTLIDNPILTDISGISQFENYPFAEFLIENNPLLEKINFPLLMTVDPYFRIQNNASLDSINIPMVGVAELTIEDNPSLVHIGLSAVAWTSDFTINNNASLENIDGLADYLGETNLVITNNTHLRFYCGLRDRVLEYPTADITITGNLINPTYEEILLEGSCGNFVRRLIGYSTLSEALIDADEHDFIYVERSNTIDLPTVFLGDQNNTLVIRPQTTLTFTASFTNEGIVINHGTLEMSTGSLFSNSGAFVNTGQLIAN